MRNTINQGSVTTTLVYSIGCGNEQEATLNVNYVVRPGRPASRTEPAEADTVEIICVYSRHGVVCEMIFDAVEQDEEVHALCLNHWRARIEAARNDAADAKREEARARASLWRL